MAKKPLVGKSRRTAALIVLAAIILAAFYWSSIPKGPAMSPTERDPRTSLSLDSSNFLGERNAPVTIVEFGDYQCPSCGEFFRTVESKLIREYVETGKASLVFKDFAFYGPDSSAAAEASHCAGEQGRYWHFHNQLYSHQGGINSGWASVPNLKKLASSMQLDEAKFDECLSSGRHRPLVLKSFEEGLRAGVNATPTFIVLGPNGRVETIVGAQPYQVFEQIIDSMLIS